MGTLTRYLISTLLITLVPLAQQPSVKPEQSPSGGHPDYASTQRSLEKLLEAKVKAEWEAFKNKDKKAYADLLAEDFVAVEDDNQGMRTKSAAAGEVDRSNINKYSLFALKVIPLNPNAALVTYELTMLFPPQARVRFKRVLVSELWQKRDGKWLERYYQETRVR